MREPLGRSKSLKVLRKDLPCPRRLLAGDAHYAQDQRARRAGPHTLRSVRWNWSGVSRQWLVGSRQMNARIQRRLFGPAATRIPHPPVPASPCHRVISASSALHRAILSTVLWSGLDGCWRSRDFRFEFIRFEIDRAREESPNTSGQRTG